MKGYRRPDGRIGIRNHVAVIYTVECSRHVADMIVRQTPGSELIGFPGCYSDPYAFRMLVEVGRHPNVAAVLLVSLGCESTNLQQLASDIGTAGKRVETLVVQECGGTIKTIERGCVLAGAMVEQAHRIEPVPMTFSDLIVGVECGGSDTTSGLAANPAAGWAVDRIIDWGGTAIFSELPELLGTEPYLVKRARTEGVAQSVRSGLERAQKLGQALGQFAISVGNQLGGLTTIEEKSLGALAKAGTKSIEGVLKTAERPSRSGLYLLDKVGDVGGNQLGHYEINDSDGLISLIASGAQLIFFTTGRGSVVGSAVSPVIKICGNPNTCERLADDIDIDAGTIITGSAMVADVGELIVDLTHAVINGRQTRSESLGHKEYSIPYKPGRACDVG